MSEQPTGARAAAPIRSRLTEQRAEPERAGGGRAAPIRAQRAGRGEHQEEVVFMIFYDFFLIIVKICVGVVASLFCCVKFVFILLSHGEVECFCKA